MSITKIDKRARVTGESRAKLRVILKDKYEKGASIRQLMEQTGRSYGFIYRILGESGVAMRRRGGGMRRVGAQNLSSTR